LEKNVKKLLSGVRGVAMNYSPNNAIPYVSRVDAGTVEMIRACGIQVVTAADLIQQFEAVMSQAQLQTHIRAAKALREIVDLAFEQIAKLVSSKKRPVEYEIQQFIWDEFARRKMVSDHRPIVGVGPNSGNPHYSPPAKNSSAIEKDSFVLIDLWAKETS